MTQQLGHPGTDHPHGDQYYGGQYYGGQNYGAQPYGAPSSHGPYGPPPPAAAPTRRSGTATIIGAVALVGALLAGVGAGTYYLVNDPAPTVTAPAAAVAPAAPAPVPAAAAPTSTPTLTQVFTSSTSSAGTVCGPYTPTTREYVTSTGHQASEVRVCVPDSTGDRGVVYTRWDSTADAAAVVSDQAATTTSVDGQDTWTMGGTPQGDWHEARQADGSCTGFLDYRTGPYAVMFTAPTCSGVEQLFQQTTLPDNTTLPR